MNSKGSATAKVVFVLTRLPQAPRPPSQCVTSPTQALTWPSQVALADAPESEVAVTVAVARVVGDVVEGPVVDSESTVVTAVENPAGIDEAVVVGASQL